jgi:predicted flap endonuclease-1-like 5' DNA nuclease
MHGQSGHPAERQEYHIHIFLIEEAIMTTLIAVEGIGPKFAAKLKEVGISTAEALLEQGATPKGRKAIAEKSGIGDGLILQWVNHVDLFRIKGVGEEYADLLEEAGVDTIPELAQRKADHLVKKMAEVNLAKKLVRRLPVLSQVESWVAQAKKLPRVITY